MAGSGSVPISSTSSLGLNLLYCRDSEVCLNHIHVKSRHARTSCLFNYISNGIGIA